MMAMKAAIVDAEDEVVVDSAVAKEEWTVRKPKMAIEAIQVDTASVAVTLNNARTTEASILAAKDSDNVVTMAIATMVVDVEAVVEEEVPEVLDLETMTVDIRITVVHAMMAAIAEVVMVTKEEVEEVAAVAVAASTRVVAVVVASIRVVVAVEATMVVISSELPSPELR